MLNIGIVGAKGFLGSYISDAFKLFEVIIHPLSFRVNHFKNISINDINDKIKTLNLDYIVNCSAYTGFEDCYLNPHDAYMVNSLLPFKLGLVAERNCIRFIHISTEAVFPSGENLVKYSVLDKPNPQTIYGKSKCKGEVLISDLKFSHVIRLPRLFSAKTQIVSTLSKKIKNREIVKISDDIFSTPLHVKYASKLIADIVINFKKNEDKIIHITGDTHLSLYDLIIKLLDNNYLHFVEISSSKYFNPNPKEPQLLNCGLSGKNEFSVEIIKSINLFKEESS